MSEDKLRKWANELMKVVKAAKKDGVILNVKGGKRTPFNVTAEEKK